MRETSPQGCKIVLSKNTHHPSHKFSKLRQIRQIEYIREMQKLQESEVRRPL
jgi:hypothetical protein